MTAIAGIAQDGRVWIGGDSLSGSTSSYNTQLVRQPKVVRIPGPDDIDMLIGYTNSWRFGQIVQHAFTPPQWKKGTLEAYLSTTFVDALRKCLKDCGFALQVTEGEERSNTNWLLGYAGRLWEFQTDYSMLEPDDDYGAVGSGYEYALGSLHTTKEILSNRPAERLRLAIEAAIEHSAFVGGHVLIEYADKQGRGVRVA